MSIALDKDKRVLATDLRAATELRGLVEVADVVLYGPEMRAYGIDYQLLQSWNPRAVCTYIGPFGTTGPYAGRAATCIELLAMGGIMGITGDPAREPLQIPGHHPEFIAGMHAFTASGAALLRRNRSTDGLGENVEVSAFEAVAATAEMVCTLYTYVGAVRSRFLGRQPWGIQGEVMPCADGFVGVHPGAAIGLAIVIDRPELMEDRLFTDSIYRLEHADEFLDLLRPYLATHTRREIIEACEELRIPFGAVLEVPDLLADEQLEARNFFEPILAGGREVFAPGPVYRSYRSVDPASASPRLSATPRRPLEGVTIVDLSWVWAGPASTRILAELGADVIKIEAPHRPDSVRALVLDGNRTDGEYWNRAGYFNEKNLGKRGMTLNLADKEGKEIFLELVREADVVVESFSPRVMEQLNLSFDLLAKERPGLIMASLSGYGQTGPARNRVAFGAALEPEAGITATIGYPDGPPFKSGLAYSDPISGVAAAGAIIYALLERESLPGVSVHLDVAERETILPFITEDIVRFQVDGTLPRRHGNRHPRCAPQGCFRCKGADRWVVVTVRTNEQWQALSQVIGAPRLAELKETERRAREAELEALIADYCVSRDATDVCATLRERGVPSAVVNSGRDLLHDPELTYRQFFAESLHPVVGKKPYPRFLGATFEKSGRGYDRSAPLLDEHTESILRTLGRSSDEISTLKARGVWGHSLTPGSRPNLALPLDFLLAQGAISAVDRTSQDSPRGTVQPLQIDTIDQFIVAAMAYLGRSPSEETAFPSAESFEAGLRRWWSEVANLEILATNLFKWKCIACRSEVVTSDPLFTWPMFDYIFWENCPTCREAFVVSQ